MQVPIIKSNVNPWASKGIACARLAADQRGRPEGDVALAKLKLILLRHSEVRNFALRDRPLVECDLELLTLDELARKVDMQKVKQHSQGTSGHWEGLTPEAALRLMLIEYVKRSQAKLEFELIVQKA